ncbi:MAG: alpha/beta hydrolase fold domain-containing protein, partial [Nocardioides sp.]
MRLAVQQLIDPDLFSLVEPSRSFYADRVPGRGPSSLAELRDVRASLPAPAPCDPAPVEETVSADGRSVRVRIHPPVVAPPAAVVLEMHGGGFYLGSAAASDRTNRRLADALGAVVLSVDYRLAPEHPWPAAPDDCETAALWLADHARERFGTTRLALIGFSAGATLAMATLLRM